MSAPSVSVIVLAFDEEENAEAVLGELAAWLDAHEPEAEIVFVDDGSRDRTSEVAARVLASRRHVLVRHETNRGMGAAIKSGVRASHAPWVTFLPCDGQLPPETIGILRREQARTGADVVFSVYDHRDDGLDRKLFSLAIRALIFAVHGVWMKSDGAYLFRRVHFVPEDLPPDTFFLNFEFPIRAKSRGLRTSVVTAECRPRRAGHSKSTQWHRIVGVGKDLIDLRVRRWTSR